MISSVLVPRTVKTMASQTGADKPLSFENRVYSRQQLTCCIRLDDIATSAGAQGFFYDVSGAVFAHEENFGCGGDFSDSASDFNPIQCRKTDIE
jgi:hypothetical protein